MFHSTQVLLFFVLPSRLTQAYSGHNYATGSSNYLVGPSKQPFGGQRPNYDRKIIAEGKKNTFGLFCCYCKRTNHTVENCYRLIGFPADFKFPKSKRLGPSAKNNATYSVEENGGNSGDKPMTQDQYHTLLPTFATCKARCRGF